MLGLRYVDKIITRRGVGCRAFSLGLGF
jgi:hypothetical protein